MLSISPWMAGMAAALFLVLGLFAVEYAGREGLVAVVARVALVLIGGVVAWFVLEGADRREFAAERRALDARATDLLTRAPSSALSCLDASAGDSVEGACEKALFATPEATAAAVSYVSAQLTLLADMTAHFARSGTNAPTALGLMRRAVEADRYGFVARVLAVRDGCTPNVCAAFALLNDTRGVIANLRERTYDLQVLRYASAWPTANKAPVASVTPTAPQVAANAPAPGIFLPSSASIPPVSIMNSEPQLPGDNVAAPSARQTARAPQRRSAPSNVQSKGNGAPRQPVDVSATTGSAPRAFAPQ